MLACFCFQMTYSCLLYGKYNVLIQHTRYVFFVSNPMVKVPHCTTFKTSSRLYAKHSSYLHEQILTKKYLRSYTRHNLEDVRYFHLFAIRPGQSKSKLEESLKEKKKQTFATTESQIDIVAKDLNDTVSLKKGKKSLYNRFIAEVKHYYHGFRLLGLDIGIAASSLRKIVRGEHLLHRERRQFRRAVSDIFRLAPFSVLIIIPFSEFAFPFIVRFFPGILPSTFETSSTRDSRLKKELKIKLEIAKFLQNTVEDIAIHTNQPSNRSDAAKKFVNFFKQTCSSHGEPTNEEILQHAKLFKNEYTLENMDRLYLVALCRLIQVPAVGTNDLLRFLIRMKLNQLHADDEMITEEGVDSLTTQELVVACHARGMRALGHTRTKLKEQLNEWVDLHLNHDVPSSLLLLSRVLYLPETVPVEERVKAAISTLPEKVAGEAEVRASELNLERADNTARYKAAKLENAEIVAEKKKAIQEQANKNQPLTDKKLSGDPSKQSIRTHSETLSEETIFVDTAQTVNDAKKITQGDIDVIQDAIGKITNKRVMSTDASLKTELDDLREDVMEYKSNVEALTAEIKQGNVDAQLLDTTAGKLIQNRIGKMINKMEITLIDLEQLERQNKEDTSRAVAVHDLVEVVHFLTKLPEKKLLHIFGTFDLNKDGHVDLMDTSNMMKVLKQENVEVTSQQLEEIVKLLIKQMNIEDSKAEKVNTFTEEMK